MHRTKKQSKYKAPRVTKVEDEQRIAAQFQALLHPKEATA
jgi:hypothetical protein